MRLAVTLLACFVAGLFRGDVHARSNVRARSNVHARSNVRVGREALVVRIDSNCKLAITGFGFCLSPQGCIRVP